MVTAHRASILHFLADPDKVALEDAYQYFADGLLVIEDGHIRSLGNASEMLPTLESDVELIEYSNCLIMPGFIDTHIHYPQTEMIAAYGEQLLEWLNTYTFPIEAKFSDPTYARDIAERFDFILRDFTC